jgi:zinc transport system substrate-binding protein
VEKRTYAIIGVLVATIIIGAVAGLYFSSNPSPSSAKLKVIATFYPLYDFVQNVGSDKVDVSILVPETDDVHDFEPTPSSIATVASANVLIFNGAGLEPWIQEVVSASGNTNLIQVNTSQGIQLLPVSPQFQQGNNTIDPHIWFDPVNAKQQVNNILQGLISRARSSDILVVFNFHTFIFFQSYHLFSVSIGDQFFVSTAYFL